jgi:serine phosphatase RsbU (regulator of sigma subunit)/CRP-like cAMP-binding protein
MIMVKKAETTLTDLGFTPEESHTIIKIGVIRTFPEDSIVVESCYLSEFLYIILEGRVDAYFINLQGKTTLLAHYDIGDYFGGIEFGDAPHSTSVKTVEASRFLRVRISDLKALLPETDKFTKQVFENLLNDVEKKAHELSEVIQQKRAISEILSTISNSPTNLHSLLETVAENAARLCEANDSAIMQVEDDKLRIVAKYGSTQLWPIGTTRNLSRDWVTGRAVLDLTPIHVLDLQAETSDFPEGSVIAKRCGHRTVFVVPLVREGSAIGAILIRRFEVNPVTEKQMELLKTFADQAAIAIENVRLFKEIKKKSRKLKEQSKELEHWNATLESRVADQVSQLEQFARLEHELIVASDIQKSMLPRSIPRFKGYEFYAHMIPAKSVGGDFYDFIPLGNDLIAIAIGDVADKGVPAALFMAMVRSFLRAEVRPGISPKKILERVNRHIVDLNDKDVFVTVLLGLLDGTKKQFSYTRAGHEMPVVINNKGSAKRLSRGKGQVLGVFDSVDLDIRTIDLPNEHMMLLYTDGITDAINQRNKMFGLEGILRTISRVRKPSASRLCKALIKDVTRHQRNILQFDDMTVVAVRAVADLQCS